MVISAAYNGALVAALAVPTLTPGIETLEELAGQSKILWTVRKSTSLHTLFEVRIRSHRRDSALAADSTCNQLPKCTNVDQHTSHKGASHLGKRSAPIVFPIVLILNTK